MDEKNVLNDEEETTVDGGTVLPLQKAKCPECGSSAVMTHLRPSNSRFPSKSYECLSCGYMWK